MPGKKGRMEVERERGIYFTRTDVIHEMGFS